ncbi:ABC transporter permease [Micromonospora sp. NBC_01655]|uniref:ABC transporter permease n=1 Tax=Micromonospora sp. NBC_01655 TaxID=2975983 RepID=UPI0022514C5F|nr:ABC transporter permease [Micromonospora sp. NBC_01655]MCX4474614.1 ABC transporter permease [Micromonospora sp. NBC_01655]
MSDLLRGAALSYRALFTWLNPLGYLSSRIVRPIGIAVVFTATTSHYGAPLGPTLVGTSLLAGAHAVIYGMALAVGNERNFGTMPIWLASPQNILGAVCQRALPHLADGFVSGFLTYLVCSALYRNLLLPIDVFAVLLLLALVSAFGTGLVVAGLNLRVRDTFLWPNIAVLAMILFSGVLLAPAQLPGLLRPAASAFPLSHLMSSVRAGPGLGHLADSVLAELVTGACWAAAGVLVVRFALRRRPSD